MPGTESIEEFYKYKFDCLPDEQQKAIGHFNVFRIEEPIINKPVRFSRRDFYKIMLVRGHYIFHYADKSLEINKSTLLFFNPMVAYKMERLSEESSGYYCIFKETFFTDHIRGNFKDLPVFTTGGKAAYVLTEQQDAQISAVYEKIENEMGSEYAFKYDLIRSYMMEIIHQALKMQPSETLYHHADANARITAVFNDMLERQFPIESVSQQFNMRSPKDFATRLNVHVNHLNRAIKTTTGKTTTELIFERMVAEAKALLKHTSWNVAEISNCLGFEEPAHFNHFFKRLTDANPTAYRVL